MTLTKQYSWEELCGLTLEKIQGSLKATEIPTFKKWFMKREKVGYLFDYQMILRCFRIWQELEQGLDHFLVIAGREGFGKSTFSFQIAAWVNPNGFGLNNICYGTKSYLDILSRKAKECLDE